MYYCVYFIFFHMTACQKSIRRGGGYDQANLWKYPQYHLRIRIISIRCENTYLGHPVLPEHFPWCYAMPMRWQQIAFYSAKGYRMKKRLKFVRKLMKRHRKMHEWAFSMSFTNELYGHYSQNTALRGLDEFPVRVGCWCLVDLIHQIHNSSTQSERVDSWPRWHAEEPELGQFSCEYTATTSGSVLRRPTLAFTQKKFTTLPTIFTFVMST